MPSYNLRDQLQIADQLDNVKVELNNAKINLGHAKGQINNNHNIGTAEPAINGIDVICSEIRNIEILIDNYKNNIKQQLRSIHEQEVEYEREQEEKRRREEEEKRQEEERERERSRRNRR